MNVDLLQQIVAQASQIDCNLMDDEVRVILVDNDNVSHHLSVIMSNRDDDNWKIVDDSFWVRNASLAAKNEKNVWVMVPMEEINYRVDKPIAIRDEHILSMVTDLIRMRRM